MHPWAASAAHFSFSLSLSQMELAGRGVEREREKEISLHFGARLKMENRGETLLFRRAASPPHEEMNY